MKFRLIDVHNARIIGRAQTKIKEPQPLSVPPSGLTDLVINGEKCTHGVYIPENSKFPRGIAPYCSICRPFEIISKER